MQPDLATRVTTQATGPATTHARAAHAHGETLAGSACATRSEVARADFVVAFSAMSPDTRDDELLEAIAAGAMAAEGPSHHAERLLCERYAPRIRLYGLRHLRERERAEDLVQAVLMAVLVAARQGRIEERDKLDRFVLGTCRNTALRMHSQARRDEPVSDTVLAQLPGPSSDQDVLGSFASADTRALMRCFSGLDSRAKQVVMLAFREERSADEIATELSISAGNVRVLRHRALSSLRKCMDGTSAGTGSVSV
jgi:RNA polymerase sigma-70 factor (ECF subfamily)